MKNTVILPEIYLHALNAFDVGNNPEHINIGLTKTGLVSWVENQIDKLSSTHMLTISGHALELLDEEAPELVDKMKEAVQNNAISLCGVPYYNTSLSLLSPKNFMQQWNENQNILSTYLGKEAHTFYVGKQSIPKHLSETVKNLGVSLIGESSLDVDTILLGEESQKELQEVGEHSPYHHQRIHSGMAEHVRRELIAIEPFLAQDKELSTTWQLLANTQVLGSLEGDDPQKTYNNFSSIMNILNDVAHTIRNVELTKQGKFDVHAQIVEAPSMRILDVINNETHDEVNN